MTARDLEKGVKKDAWFHVNLAAGRFHEAVSRLAEQLGEIERESGRVVSTLIGVETLGAVLASALAATLQKELALIRKGRDVESKDRDNYFYEEIADHSGAKVLRLWKGALKPDELCVLVDDQIQTAGQILGAAKLVGVANAEVMAALVMMCSVDGRRVCKGAGLDVWELGI